MVKDDIIIISIIPSLCIFCCICRCIIKCDNKNNSRPTQILPVQNNYILEDPTQNHTQHTTQNHTQHTTQDPTILT